MFMKASPPLKLFYGLWNQNEFRNIPPAVSITMSRMCLFSSLSLFDSDFTVLRCKIRSRDVRIQPAYKSHWLWMCGPVRRVESSGSCPGEMSREIVKAQCDRSVDVRCSVEKVPCRVTGWRLLCPAGERVFRSSPFMYLHTKKMIILSRWQDVGVKYNLILFCRLLLFFTSTYVTPEVIFLPPWLCIIYLKASGATFYDFQPKDLGLSEEFLSPDTVHQRFNV